MRITGEFLGRSKRVVGVAIDVDEIEVTAVGDLQKSFIYGSPEFTVTVHSWGQFAAMLNALEVSEEDARALVHRKTVDLAQVIARA